jgi:hypothetical protein
MTIELFKPTVTSTAITTIYSAMVSHEHCFEDKVYIERVIFARLFKRCIDSAQAKSVDDDEDAATYELPDWFDDTLGRACRAGLPTFDSRYAADVGAHIDALQAKYLSVYVDRPLMLAILVVWFAFQDVLEQELYILIDGSDLADCTDVLALVLGDGNLDGLRDGVAKSARKNAMRLLRSMKDDGLFSGWDEASSILRGA